MAKASIRRGNQEVLCRFFLHSTHQIPQKRDESSHKSMNFRSSSLTGTGLACLRQRLDPASNISGHSGEDMNSKILGLLVAGLLAGPMAANANGVVAGFDVVTDTESKFSGSFNFIVHQGGDYDVASSHGLLPFLDPNPDDDDTPVCNLFGNRNWGNDANFGSGFLLAACPGTPQNPEFTGALNDSAQSFSPVGGLFTNSAAGVPVYWSFTALQDTGTIDGVFSGAFCFSRVDGVCSASTVPEPGTLALLGVGLAGLAASRRRKR